MRMADRERVFELAAQQLPTAALYGIGGELVRLTEALDAKERLVRLAVASDGRSFGVLALTIRRVLWVPSSEPTAMAFLATPPGALRRVGAVVLDLTARKSSGNWWRCGVVLFRHGGLGWWGVCPGQPVRQTLPVAGMGAETDVSRN